MAENKISKKEKGLDKSKENLAALVEATPLLEYHKEALTEIIDKDALLITARCAMLMYLFHIFNWYYRSHTSVHYITLG